MVDGARRHSEWLDGQAAEGELPATQPPPAAEDEHPTILLLSGWLCLAKPTPSAMRPGGSASGGGRSLSFG